MSRTFFAKMAVSNIKKNRQSYIPYILSCVVTTAMFYLVRSLCRNPEMKNMIGADTLLTLMSMCSALVALFAVIFLFYTNSFLVKRRQKEFAVFNILGMEKGHLVRMMAWETLDVFLLSLAGGLIIGIALDKAMFLLITRLLGAEIRLGFHFSAQAVLDTVILLVLIFFLVFLNSVRKIRLASPIELLQEGKAGEKEPKTKKILALLGVLCLGSGYYLALTIEDPVVALSTFFGAVFLVVIGTYLLFTAGSIALLKLLRRNKRYYYKPKHFIGISGMIYRMKQNAVGLANICILSTCVLVMVSSTSSLMLGLNNVMETRYPSDFVIYADEASKEDADRGFEAVRALQEEENLRVTDESAYSYLSFAALRDGSTFDVDEQANITDMSRVTALCFVPLEDYNAVMGRSEALADDEVLIYANRTAYEDRTLTVFDKTYEVKAQLTDFPGNGVLSAYASDTIYIVLPSREALTNLYAQQKEVYGDMASNIRYLYGFDSAAPEEEQVDFYHEVRSLYDANGWHATIDSRAEARPSMMGLYGGLFFIGIFLGLLFLMATVLIIYYKQISEGYEDKERFDIMQKVGMSHQEVRSAILSQVLTVFFLPLLAAGIHSAVAFPFVTKILELLNLTDIALFRNCALVSYGIFAIIYLAVYLLTARNYYRIVGRD